MKKWPILKEYNGEYLRRISMPLGGIGTGTVSLGGRGNLQDWAIMNTPAVGYTPQINSGMLETGPFFALYTESEGKKNTTILEGMVNSEQIEASQGSLAVNHGLPRFRYCEFKTAYPLAQVDLKDDAVPLDVSLKAFNPLIPGDSDKSGIPVAKLTYVLKNNTDKAVTASICGTIINCVGFDGREYRTDWRWDNKTHHIGGKGNCNQYREEESLKGIFMSAKKVPKRSPAWGTMALTSTSEGIVSHRTSWARKSWGNSILDFWDDFSENGELTERKATAPFNRLGSMAIKNEILPGEEKEIDFLLSWHFPNRTMWHSMSFKFIDKIRYLWAGRIGNYYTQQYKDAWDVAFQTLENLDSLEEETINFVSAFCSSDLPAAVKEAALFNISTLRTQTCFRTKDGNFFGWEGIHDTAGSCMGSCTHVWNYEQTTAFLFGDLAQRMRKIEFLLATKRKGNMHFRVRLPLWIMKVLPFPAAADGQMGCIMKAYREWQLSGDMNFLKELWPQIKKALSFCWIEGGWDADKDGVMEGCQHNTMDVEYYGPNPQMQGWYLGALKSSIKMAEAMGDESFAGECRRLFENGSRFMDEELFNGEYYEHHIQVPPKINKGLKSTMGAKDLTKPILQLGAGCLVDQLVGQYMSHTLGLGYLHKKENVKKTLQSIMKYNFKSDFHNHFNHMRSYVMNDESALLMATYPLGRRPEEPFPYYNEVMTGFEHSTAAHMLYEDMNDEGLKVIQSIRDRYDGFKRNPFDEAECGHHYARAMAAWAGVLACTGFQYSGINQTISFNAKEGNHFWSNGSAWGSCILKNNGSKWKVSLTTLFGTLKAQKFILHGKGEALLEAAVLSQNQTESFVVKEIS